MIQVRILNLISKGYGEIGLDHTFLALSDDLCTGVLNTSLSLRRAFLLPAR